MATIETKDTTTATSVCEPAKARPGDEIRALAKQVREEAEKTLASRATKWTEQFLKALEPVIFKAIPAIRQLVVSDYKKNSYDTTMRLTDREAKEIDPEFRPWLKKYMLEEPYITNLSKACNDLYGFRVHIDGWDWEYAENGPNAEDGRLVIRCALLW
ncbi:MAG: hypothetical protein KGL39_13150 [Patescibacteria group bacterium]|nr:hypothetical protein [Patescibacteria group bacterium]